MLHALVARLGLRPTRLDPPPPRFLVQNILRCEQEGGARFDPTAVDLGAADNVLDRRAQLPCNLPCVPCWIAFAAKHALCAGARGPLGRWQRTRRAPAGAPLGCAGVAWPPAPTADTLPHPRGRRWIGAASRSLVAFVREEMAAYRLYTVVPYLIQVCLCVCGGGYRGVASRWPAPRLFPTPASPSLSSLNTPPPPPSVPRVPHQRVRALQPQAPQGKAGGGGSDEGNGPGRHAWPRPCVGRARLPACAAAARAPSLSAAPAARRPRPQPQGGKGPADCALALATLYDVLLTACKVGAVGAGGMRAAG